MASGASSILGGPHGNEARPVRSTTVNNSSEVSQVDPPANLKVIPPTEKFVHEFLRVQCDKFLLAGLVVFLVLIHADSHITAGAVGGLVMLIQGRRFKL